MVSLVLRLCVVAGILHHMEAACEWRKYPKSALYGNNDKVHKDVTLSKCEELCEKESEFSCESFDYSTTTSTCFLSQNSRHTEPESFGKHAKLDYYEMECDDDEGSSGEGSGGDTDGRPTRCWAGWVQRGLTCYKFVLHSDKTWSGAKADCEREPHAHLVTIDSQDEMDFLGQKILSLVRYTHHELFWTAGRKSASSWVWDTNGLRQRVTFSKWYPGEPNNERDREDVINFLYMNGQWGFNDGYAEQPLRYICEVSLV